MPIPDFSPGEIWTSQAADSIGMWKIAEGNLSSSITNFAGCFSSNYRNYRVIIDDVKLSAQGDLYIQYFTTGTTVVTGNNYYWAYRGIAGNGASQDSAANAQSAGFLGWGTTGAGGQGGVVFDVITPQVTAMTLTSGTSFYLAGSLGTYASRQGSIAWDTNAQLTGFRLNTLNAGVTFTSGTVRIYGYRN